MKNRFKLAVTSLLTMGYVLVAVTYVWSASVPHRNLAALSNLAKWIFVGKVISVTDNYVEGQLPYTEITFQIRKSIKGGLQEGSNFSYRQVGLLEPRDAGNGLRIAFVIHGLPQYQVDKEVMVFLYGPSAVSGLTSPVGLLQGKFTIDGDKIFNGINNKNLFANMKIAREEYPGKLSEKYVHILSQTQGPVNTDAFIDLVSKAVKQRIFE